MEEHLSLVESQESLVPLNKPKTSNTIAILKITAIALVLVLFSIVFYLNFQSINRINTLTEDITTLKVENESFKKIAKEKDDLNFSLNLLQADNLIQRIQHRVEGGIVTDDFVVDKFSITALPILTDKTDDKGFLTTTIDLITQPGGKSGYTGQGKFSVTDRELRAMILDILDKVSADYNPGKNNPYNLPKWEDGSHYVTIKNYEIGTFEKGVFKLKGE